MSREDEGLALTTRTSGDELSQVLSMIELGLMDLEDSVWKCGCGTGDLTRREGSWDELPYWSRAESRNSKGKILKCTKRTGDDNLYETCVAISGQAVIYIVGSLPEFSG